MEFDENPRFWYPRVALNALINFSSRTVELQPSECRKNLPFCFSLPFLSLSPYPFASFSPVYFPPLLLFFIPRIPCFPLCLLLLSLPFFIFSLLPFSLFLSFFLFFLFLFSSFFSFLILPYLFLFPSIWID